jgi:hypothetical protein
VAAARYRFLPWARRGFASRLAPVTALPARASVPATLIVSSIPEVSRALEVYGPGDVVGIDPRAIVRTSPRAGATEVEPNYLPHIEFDAPDFPWLFTPAGAPADDRLAPWCVLVVVDLEVVAAPATRAGQPLPILSVRAESAATELPDLTESWAWAHAQALDGGDAADLAAQLASEPARNVSRIVAARRLEPGKRYAACLVPAFDGGVRSGLGAEPAGDLLAPAWTAGASVELPVYHHWEFATGPAGDFEALARRLRPFEAPADTGTAPMDITDVGVHGTLAMDGAMRALGRPPARLDDVPTAVQVAVRGALDTDAGALAPPVYGAWHAGVHSVADGVPVWLRELNLDPRARAAAGLGAEIERADQEQFMQWCWEQVGRILEANGLLSRARLSLEVLAGLHARHIAPLPPDRAFALAAPLHPRARLGGGTVAAAVAASSLPDAATDAALRRLTSPARATLRRVAPTRTRLVDGLARGTLDVDPTRFTPHGLLGVPELSGLALPATGDVDLASVGLRVSVPAAVVKAARDATVAAAGAPAPVIRPRPDLHATGLVVPDVPIVKPVHHHPPLAVPVHPPLHLPGPVVIDAVHPVHDVTVIGRFERALARAAPQGQIEAPAPQPALVAFDVAVAAQALVERTDPRRTVPARIAGMLGVGGAGLLSAPIDGIAVAPGQDRVTAAPELDVPVSEYLAALDPERFLPGVGAIPDEAITLLGTNPRFAEALLAGLNDEMNRELLWRGFPTDQRGTPFRRFWRWADGGPDVAPIDEWAPAAQLGENARGGPGGQVALLVRGRLLHRYPNAAIYAWRARTNAQGEKELTVPPDVRLPMFGGVLGADVAFVGFDLTDADLDSGDGWFFVLQEQPAEPRFGFDELLPGDPLPPLATWSDATWEHTGTAPGGWLRIAGNPLAQAQVPGAHFVDDAAHLAAIALQKPVRVAVHAGQIRGHG